MMNTIITSLQNELLQLTEKAVTYRKHFHKHPELSGREIQTSQFIEEQLLSLGITEIVRYPDYGLSALIKGPEDAPVVGIRAEMDALPIDEANDVDYASNNQGVMHACGHDVHMGIVLSVAGFFHQHREKLPVSIKLIFQPSEETLPGGAIQMINNGVLKNPEVNYMLGMHVLPEMKAGNVGFRPGIYMASSDEIFLTLIGKGGHAAMPHLLNDPVVCAAQILTSVQQVISRRASPEIPSVLSFGNLSPTAGPM
jgi:amidohydrolase